jgi:hypothetical protein
MARKRISRAKWLRSSSCDWNWRLLAVYRAPSAMTQVTALHIVASTLRIFPQNVGLSLTSPPSAFKLQEIDLFALQKKTTIMLTGAPKVRLDESL